MNDRRSVSHVEHVMGTAVSFDLRDADTNDADTNDGGAEASHSAIEAAVSWLHHVDTVFSTYRDDSEISRFGRGEVRFDQLSEETAAVLLTCRELEVLTEGAFDAFAVPAVNGTHVDPSGYVKGWSVERAAMILDEAGLQNFCINAGGDIAVRGQATASEPWKVGIRHPDLPDRFAKVLWLTGPQAVATSATYERGAHIVDPRSGRPATGLLSATVVGRDLGYVDACATAVFVMGLNGLGWAEAQSDLEAFVIYPDRTTAWTSGFPASRR
jgi:FAD:protein FMN transferase